MQIITLPRFPRTRCRRTRRAAGGFVIADIPGLIEGASEGVGLGHEFLRHIERTRVMIHVVDVASTEGRDPVDDINKINKELEAYNPEIAKRPQIIAANKTDAIYVEEGEEDPVERLKKRVRAERHPGLSDFCRQRKRLKRAFICRTEKTR